MPNQYLIEAIVEEIQSRSRVLDSSFSILVGVSNRHVHLSRQDIDKLFGVGYKLTPIKDLKQPGQFAAKEMLCIAGPKGSFSNVRILGPARDYSQVEISASDAYALGIDPPLRISGELDDAVSVCAIGPKGMAVLNKSVIMARRHVHMTPHDALKYGVENNDVVRVLGTGNKRCLFYDTIVRVAESSALEFHIDTDESNASGLKTGCLVQIAGKG